VVVDTGVVVSAVLLPRSIPRQAFDLASALGRLLVSADTVAELDEVLRRTKFNK
jgi:predicted nucleic acid-binding protein